MSALAIWLFVVVAVLFLGAVAAVLLAFRSTWRKSKAFAQEMDGLSRELEHVIGSQQHGGLNG